MNITTLAFLLGAIATSTGALAFLAAQRASGRTPPAVQRCYENALLLEATARDLTALCEEAAKENAGETRETLQAARDELEEAISRLRRGADAVV